MTDTDVSADAEADGSLPEQSVPKSDDGLSRRQLAFVFIMGMTVVLGWIFVRLQLESGRMKGLQNALTLAAVVGVVAGVVVAYLTHDEPLTHVYYHDIDGGYIGDLYANRAAVRDSEFVNGMPSAKVDNAGRRAISVNGWALGQEAGGLINTSGTNSVDLPQPDATDDTPHAVFACTWRDYDFLDAWTVETDVARWLQHRSKILPRAQAYPLAVADAETAHVEGYDKGVRTVTREHADRTRGSDLTEWFDEHRRKTGNYLRDAGRAEQEHRQATDDEAAETPDNSLSNGDSDEDGGIHLSNDELTNRLNNGGDSS